MQFVVRQTCVRINSPAHSQTGPYRTILVQDSAAPFNIATPDRPHTSQVQEILMFELTSYGILGNARRVGLYAFPGIQLAIQWLIRQLLRRTQNSPSKMCIDDHTSTRSSTYRPYYTRRTTYAKCCDWDSSRWCFTPKSFGTLAFPGAL